MKRRDKIWIAAHVGCLLDFSVNGQTSSGVLDYDRSIGMFCFKFYGGQVNAEICEIADNANFKSEGVSFIVVPYPKNPKPCPLCGCDVNTHKEDSPDGTINWLRISHGPTINCGISFIDLEDIAIDKWNNRLDNGDISQDESE